MIPEPNSISFLWDQTPEMFVLGMRQMLTGMMLPSRAGQSSKGRAQGHDVQSPGVVKVQIWVTQKGYGSSSQKKSWGAGRMGRSKAEDGILPFHLHIRRSISPQCGKINYQGLLLCSMAMPDVSTKQVWQESMLLALLKNQCSRVGCGGAPD